MSRETLLHLKTAVRFATKAMWPQEEKNRRLLIERAMKSLTFAMDEVKRSAAVRNERHRG